MSETSSPIPAVAPIAKTAFVQSLIVTLLVIPNTNGF